MHRRRLPYLSSLRRGHDENRIKALVVVARIIRRSG
jgi:hypothetical protein